MKAGGRQRTAKTVVCRPVQQERRGEDAFARSSVRVQARRPTDLLEVRSHRIPHIWSAGGFQEPGDAVHHGELMSRITREEMVDRLPTVVVRRRKRLGPLGQVAHGLHHLR